MQNEDVKFEPRIIAFLDILGFKELNREKAKRDFIIEIIELIRPLNSDFSISQTPGQQPGSQNIQFTPDFSSSSDHMIISVPINTKECPFHNVPESIRIPLLFTAIVNLITHLYILTLSNDISLRGAIAFGDIFYNKENNIILGEPLDTAVDYEKKFAIYPRVIICPSLLNYNKILHPTRRDFDGLFSVDWMQALVVPNPDAIEKDAALDILKRIRSNIYKNITVYKDKENYSISSKWCWLANYFDLKIQFWNINNRDCPIDKFSLLNNNIENMCDLT